MRAILYTLAVALSLAPTVGAAPPDAMGCVQTETGEIPFDPEHPLTVTPDYDPSTNTLVIVIQGPGLYARVTVTTSCIPG